MPEFEVVGHRGDGAGPGENTPASFKAAIAAGANRLEADVQLIGGELVLAHPPRRPRMSLADLLRLTSRPLILHLKRRHFSRWHDRRAVVLLAPLITGREDITVSSVWPGTLRYLKRTHPKIRTMFNTWWPTYDLFFSKGLGVAEYNCWHRTTTARTVARAKRRGIGLSVFVVPPTEAARRRFARLGIHRLMTDHVSFFVRPRGPRSRRVSARGNRRAPTRRG